IHQARPKIDPDNGTTFDGRVFTASQALARGLIDQIGFADTAIALARQLGHCPEAGVVLYHRHNDPARTIYAQTPNPPLQGGTVLPGGRGWERSRLPLSLILWRRDLPLGRRGGK